MTLLVGNPEAREASLTSDEGEPRQSRTLSVPRPQLFLLAATALGAALLHAAFAPGHFAETWSHGLAFAVMAWLQLALAVALLAYPSRRVFALGTLNIFIIALWVMSRTVGAPFGPNAWKAEDIGTPDVIATGLEAFLVIGCAALLWRSRDRVVRVVTGPRALLWGAIAGSLIVAAGTTVALTPRYAGEHTHGGATAADGHTHAAGTAAALTGNTPCEKTGPPASEGSITDAQGHSHRGPTEQIAIDQATAAQLADQQAHARAAAARYPTVADAEAAGYRASTVFVPCIGAHYTNIGLVGPFNVDTPSELLYDGTKPDSKIIGLSYLIYNPGGEPVGFAGPNDHWHQHNANGGLCFGKNNLVIGAEDMSREQCTAIGGEKHELVGIWMLHDWVVPGWECSWGVFAPECPELGGRLGADAWTP